MVLRGINDSLGDVKLGIDGDGNRGYYGADGSFIPFSNGISNLILFVVGRDGSKGLYYAYTENGKDFISGISADTGTEVPWGTVKTTGYYQPTLQFNQSVYAVSKFAHIYDETPQWKLYEAGSYISIDHTSGSGLIAFIPDDKFNFN